MRNSSDLTTASAGATRLGVLLGALFGLAGTGSSAMAVALPDLGGDLGFTQSETAWVLSAYALALAVSTAVYGRVADLVGIRTPMLVGVTLMAVGALGSALMSSLPLIVATRLIQGAGAGSVPVLATALISARYAGPVRSAALGRVAGLAASVTCLGPLAGGVLVDALDWRAVIALPALGLLFLPVLVRVAPTGGSGGRLDLTGATLVTAFGSGLVLLLQSPSAGPVVGIVGAVLLVGAVPLFAAHLRRRPDGFLPREVLRNARVVRASLAAASLPAAWFALLLAVPAILIGRGWSPVQVGLALIPAAVTGPLASRFAGGLIPRIGTRRVLGVTAIASALVLLLAGLAAQEGWPVLLAASVAGLSSAFGAGQPALVAAVSDAVEPAVRGVALGAATLVFLVGAGVGSATVGGLSDSLTMAGAVSLVAVFPALGATAILARRRVPEPAFA